MSLIWDKGNRGHAAKKHDVQDAEIDQLFGRPYYFEAHEAAEYEEENQYRAYGTTDKGRFLTVPFTVRGGRIRPITAWPMEEDELQIYVENSSE